MRAVVKTSTDWKLSTASNSTGCQRHPRPLMMRQWKHLWPGELVELRRGNSVLGTAYVDDLTEDGSTIWVQLTNGLGRVLLHHEDGINIYTHRTP